MKGRRTVVLCWLAFVVLAAASYGAAAKNEKPVWTGVGDHISLWGDEVKYVSADSSFWIRHGWGGPRYPVSIPDYMADGQGIVTMGGALFELYIDGVQVHLSVQNRNADVEPGGNAVFRSWYVQLEPGDLAPGEHVITGVWSSRNPQSDVNTVLEGGYSITITLVVEP